MELNFDDILSGKEAKPNQSTQKTQEVKLKQTETRARQQSCMINEIDKDLVPCLSCSFLQTLKSKSKTLESASQTCSILYFILNLG